MKTFGFIILLAGGASMVYSLPIENIWICFAGGICLALGILLWNS